MLLLKIAVEKLSPSQRSSLDIQLSFFSFLCFITVCLIVALLKATYAENVHIVLSNRYQKVFIFNLLGVVVFGVSLIIDVSVYNTWII